MKAAADAARPHGIKISVETRGVVGPNEAELGMKPWEFMVGIIKDAGANSNVDIGNVGAANQKELDDCIKAWFPHRPVTCTSSRAQTGTWAPRSG